MNKIILDIKKAIEKQGISETLAAKKAGLEQSKVNRLLAGKTKRLYTALQERIEKVGTGLLMTNPRTNEAYKDLRKAIENAAERAGVNKHIYNHLFRHTYTSRSHEAGVSLADLQEQLGHADIKTTRMYTHIATGKRVTQSKKLDDYLTSEKTRLINHEAEKRKKETKTDR